jgi:serine/threonine protein phosphatase 1
MPISRFPSIRFGPTVGEIFTSPERAESCSANRGRFSFSPSRAASALLAILPRLRWASDRREEAGSSLPPGWRIYAIGDIHGRVDLLDSLVETIRQDALDQDYETCFTVFLGDYVDRGPSSAQVLDRLASQAFPTPFIALRGNHEAVMLAFLEDDSILDKWRHFGGVETLASYNVDVSDVMRGRGFKAAQQALRRSLPSSHLEFLEGTRLSYTIGDYFFCHAGVRPGIALDAQEPRDLLWIRDEFLTSPERFSKRIVHGHNPAEAAELLPNRINADTGAYATNVLTAVVLQESDTRILDTSGFTALDLTNS